MIKIENVSKRYRSPVLRQVNLEVPTSSIYALIGPGAAGKSVLLKTIAGLVKPDEGHVMLDGENVTEMKPLELAEMRKKVGFLFQNYALFDRTVLENIGFPLKRLFGTPQAEIEERVAERLERVALPGIEHRMPGGLSGGQKKRVGVARATIAQPPYVLYDEPTAGLDPVTSQKICDLIKEEQRRNKATVMVISSDLARVLSIADRVGMLLNGRLIFDGTVDEARNSSNPYVDQFVHGKTEGPL